MTTTPEKLFVLWVFLFINFLFCDVMTLFHAPTLSQLVTGTVDGMEMNQSFLLIMSAMMEIGMIMILVSRLAPYRWNRWANIVIGVFFIVVQTITVIMPGLTLHYAFFSAIEIATLAWIVWTAWGWQAVETGAEPVR